MQALEEEERKFQARNAAYDPFGKVSYCDGQFNRTLAFMLSRLGLGLLRRLPKALRVHISLHRKLQHRNRSSGI